MINSTTAFICNYKGMHSKFKWTILKVSWTIAVPQILQSIDSICNGKFFDEFKIYIDTLELKYLN